MKAVFYKVPKPVDQSIRAEKWEPADFFTPLHYHKECQLTLILSGTGQFYTTDSSTPFRKDDLFLIGQNLPHVFKSDLAQSTSAQEQARAITVFFDHSQLSAIFQVFPETEKLLKLCSDSRYGIKSSLNPGSGVPGQMKSLLMASAIDKISDLIKILEEVAHKQHFKYISHQSLSLKDPLDSNKIENILDFIRSNYKKRLTLEDIAAQINMSPSAFCRFFKKKTAQTITDYLINIRISAACKMLTQGDFTVSETCYESGYNSTSNFHRHFRRVTGCSPKEYKRRLLD